MCFIFLLTVEAQAKCYNPLYESLPSNFKTTTAKLNTEVDLFNDKIQNSRCNDFNGFQCLYSSKLTLDEEVIATFRIEYAKNAIIPNSIKSDKRFFASENLKVATQYGIVLWNAEKTMSTYSLLSNNTNGLYRITVASVEDTGEINSTAAFDAIYTMIQVCE